MPKATWRGVTLAEADAASCQQVEGNWYFPPAALRREHLRPSSTHTTCAWKGEASYYDVIVGDDVNKDAAWFYPTPKDAAARIKDHVAFWRGVQVEG